LGRKRSVPVAKIENGHSALTKTPGSKKQVSILESLKKNYLYYAKKRISEEEALRATFKHVYGSRTKNCRLALEAIGITLFSVDQLADN
jgi:hypothetical protein